MLIIRNAFLNLPAMILKHLNLDVYALNYFNRLILFTAHEQIYIYCSNWFDESKTRVVDTILYSKQTAADVDGE